MDEIAERAGVSKPVLYQHFPGKLEPYLALLDAHTRELVAAVEAALASTPVNKLRVAAAIEAYFDFADREGRPFRLVFESDLTSDPAVRRCMEDMSLRCGRAIATVIAEDTGLPEAEAHLLGMTLVGTAQESARAWIKAGRPIPRESAHALISQLAWRGIRGFPKLDGETGDPDGA
jgi:AcrR family transcriptional regulator